MKDPVSISHLKRKDFGLGIVHDTYFLNVFDQLCETICYGSIGATKNIVIQGEYITPEIAPWNLGRWGTVINVISVAWIVFITILFSIPPNELAGWAIIILGEFMFIYWQVDVKRRFKGPTPAGEEELRRIES